MMRIRWLLTSLVISAAMVWTALVPHLCVERIRQASIDTTVRICHWTGDVRDVGHVGVRFWEDGAYSFL